jgi:hypothetical protein
MDISAKKEILKELGSFYLACAERYRGKEVEKINTGLETFYDRGLALIEQAGISNAWFTPESVVNAFEAWGLALSETSLDKWLNAYKLERTAPKKVGVIMAGNIPLVGLHDALCVLLSNHVLKAKLSSKDTPLMQLSLEILGTLSSEWKERIELTNSLKEIDVLIATGSDNSARYFEYYFRDQKKLIRKNRTSVAVLMGDENEEELAALAEDVFTYFGLGCRNVTKLYLPKGFDLDRLFNAFFKFKELINHNKYANNYDYNKAVYLLNKHELIENGFLLMKEEEALHSPVGVLFYEYYTSVDEVMQKIQLQKDQIQCLVSRKELGNNIPFGKAQRPDLWNYADNIDTLAFLLKE